MIINHRQPDRDAVARLAKEIGAEFRPEHEGFAFQARWVRKLAAEVERYSHFGRQLRYREMVIAWSEEIIRCPDGELLALLDRTRNGIQTRDYDDGWANDPGGSAVEFICLALLPHTRWLAHAGEHIWRYVTGCHAYNEVVSISRQAWLRNVYERCTRPE